MRNGLRKHPGNLCPRGRGAASVGSVMILALWSLFFLAALALAVGARVSADLRLATGLKARVTAAELARAGVERAVMEIMTNTTNWSGTADDDLGNDEKVFKDNESLPGGSFTVSYVYLAGRPGLVVTNYGVVKESRKININSRRGGSRERLIALGVPSDTADNILAWPSRKKRLAKQGKPGYPANYESLHELLLVDGVTGELYAQILPHVTIFRGDTFGGVSEGIAGDGLAVRRISFVFDRKVARFVHWHEL